MSVEKVKMNCPYCKKEFAFALDSKMVPTPNVRGGLKPASNILVYKITSEDMKKFITAKAHAIEGNANCKVEVVPRYCEKKRRKDNEPHHSYASLRIAYSSDVLEEKDSLGFYGKIGESDSNIKFKPEILDSLVRKYQYRRDEIDSWLDSYKNMEALEDGLGMTEAYISDLRQFAVPQRITSNTGENWIIFAAAAENVIKDMLTEKETNKELGRIQIMDIYPISKDVVEFICYVHPAEVQLKENPYVRQILLGEEKIKN